MNRNLAVIIIILCASAGNMSGQITDEKLPDNGKLSLRIKSLTFVKDNEYFNNIGTSKFNLISSLPGFADKSLWIEGYTLAGFFFRPELVYSPSKKVTVRAGAHILKYSGLSKLTQVKPVLSTTVQLLEHTSLTVGSLSGSDKHGLLDPIHNSERIYSDYSEDGFQVTTTNEHIFSDNWLSWENFIVKGDSIREIFTTGESFKYTSSPFAGFLQFEVPVQLQFKHFGGQISNFPEHVETYFNIATGLRVDADLANKRSGQAGVEYLHFFNGEFPRVPASGITHGNASWYRLHYNYKALYFGLYYWKSHNYFSPNGNQIYGSVLDTRSEYVIPDRRIITNALFVNLMPESYVGLLAGVETYYDACLRRMDFSVTLHLNFDKLIRLATIKN